jgi:hypothetical protein
VAYERAAIRAQMAQLVRARNQVLEMLPGTDWFVGFHGWMVHHGNIGWRRARDGAQNGCSISC